jgi:PAS domain S-box-containing protein
MKPGVLGAVPLKADDEIERRVDKRTAELVAANIDLALRNEELTAELRAMRRLHECSTRLLATTQLQSVLEEVLSATIELQSADSGTVQLYDPEQGGLAMVAQRNLGREFLERAQVMRDASACGRALRIRAQVVIEDIELDAEFAPHRALAAKLGLRAVQSTPLFSRSGEVLGVVSTNFRRPHRPSPHELRMTEMYARQAAEMIERRRSEEERSTLASLVQNSADFIAFATLARRALFVNTAGRKMVGIRDGEPIPPDVLSYMVEEDRARFELEIMPALERDGRWDGELRLHHFKTAEAVPVLTHTFFIHDRQTGLPIAIATISRDMTERKRSELQLSKAQDELAHVMRVLSMGELTASIAHEVNQPLAAIVANGNACLRWLARDVPDLKEARAALDGIVRDGNRAGEVLRRIRDFSTKATPPKICKSLNDTIREVLTLTAKELARERIVLRTRLAESLPAVWGDHVQLQQVVLNLIINGIDAMRGVVDRPRELSIVSSSPRSGVVEVNVRDSGTGVKPENLERLFDAFFTTKPEGMGLGLTISYRIIEAHGGQLWATPNSRRGMTMSFALPTTEAAA